MLRRKKFDFEEKKIYSYYYNDGDSLEYRIDDYNDSIENMSEAEVKALAAYIIQLRNGESENEEEDDDEEYEKAESSYIPLADPLYLGNFDDDDDE